MDVSIALGIVMILASLLAFVILHQVMHRIPWEATYPRERFRWPVFRWFPLVIIGSLVLTLASNLWFTHRATHPGPINRAFSTHDTRDDIKPVRGEETPTLQERKGPFSMPPGPSSTASPAANDAK